MWMKILTHSFFAQIPIKLIHIHRLRIQWRWVQGAALLKTHRGDSRLLSFWPSTCKCLLEIPWDKLSSLLLCNCVSHQPCEFSSCTWVSSPTQLWPVHPERSLPEEDMANYKLRGKAVCWQFYLNSQDINIISHFKKSFLGADSSVSFHKFPKTVKDNADELNYYLLLEHAVRKD